MFQKMSYHQSRFCIEFFTSCNLSICTTYFFFHYNCEINALDFVLSIFAVFYKCCPQIVMHLIQEQRRSIVLNVYFFVEQKLYYDNICDNFGVWTVFFISSL